jgi:tetratricopeptide (TPR) repeat protein
LGVFVGGCTLEAAEAVLGDDQEPDKGELTAYIPASAVLAGLASLVDKSLLKQGDVDGEPRFTMLETIREYTQEQLDASGADEVAALRRRHTAYYLALVETAEPDLMGSQQILTLERLESDHSNLRVAMESAFACSDMTTALQFSGALWRFWWIRGYLTEGRRYLEATLAASGSLSSVLRAKALHGIGVLAAEQGDYARSMVLLEAGLSLSRNIGDKRIIATYLDDMGLVNLIQGDYTRATTLLDESLALCQAIGDTIGAAFPLTKLGEVAYHQGNYDRAAAYLEVGLDLFQKQQNKREMVWPLLNLGHVALCQGDTGRAATLYAESVTLLQALKDKSGIAYALEGFARLTAQHWPEQAARLFGAAEIQRDTIGAPMLPVERTNYDQTIMAIHSRLNNEAFEAAWAEGRALPLEQAIAEALTVADQLE